MTFRQHQLSHMRRRTHADAVGGRRARDGLVEARAARRDAGCTAQMILDEIWTPIHGANCTQPPNEVLCIWGYKNKGIWADLIRKHFSPAASVCVPDWYCWISN